MYKKLGIIGGLGPLATAYFYELITKLTKVTRDQDHIEILIHSVPATPDRTAYIIGQSKESPLPTLIKTGLDLSSWGADLIAIPCITAHYFHEELAKKIPIPIINLPHEISHFIKEKGLTSVGIMATDGTINSHLFQKELLANHLIPIIPGKAMQANVMHLIYENIKLGLPPEMDRFYAVAEELKQNGAEIIILGCTELSLIKRDQNLSEEFLDAMEVLAKKSILGCGRKLSLD